MILWSSNTTPSILRCSQVILEDKPDWRNKTMNEEWHGYENQFRYLALIFLISNKFEWIEVCLVSNVHYALKNQLYSLTELTKCSPLSYSLCLKQLCLADTCCTLPSPRRVFPWGGAHSFSSELRSGKNPYTREVCSGIELIHVTPCNQGVQWIPPPI